MPVEIKELVIRAVVEEPDGEPDGREQPDEPRRGLEADRITEECVRQVLRILRRSEER